jgi:predicted helicase
MSSTHLSANLVVNVEKIFDSVASFRDLEQRIEALCSINTKIAGDAFEIFIEAYLATQATFLLDRVWLVGQIPFDIRQNLNLPADAKGIDGLFRTHSGDFVPYQVKFRYDREKLSFTEVAPFLGITERAKDRILFTNAKQLATDAANRDALRVVRRTDFDQLTERELRAIEAWLKNLPPPRPALLPMPHQEAIEHITGALTTSRRTTAVMACGSGKTLLGLWVAEAINAKTVLVLVPSLSLISQTLREWGRENPWGDNFNYLCVCSDPTVSKQSDEIILHKTDVPFRIDTDPQLVRDFLTTNLNGVRVVFSTYQSAPVVAEGAKGSTGFDIGIFDEAHKTTGPRGGTFAYALDNKNLHIEKRLFLPRLLGTIRLIGEIERVTLPSFRWTMNQSMEGYPTSSRSLRQPGAMLFVTTRF